MPNITTGLLFNNGQDTGNNLSDYQQMTDKECVFYTHTQTHTDTHRHTQTHTDTHRHTHTAQCYFAVKKKDV